MDRKSQNSSSYSPVSNKKTVGKNALTNIVVIWRKKAAKSNMAFSKRYEVLEVCYFVNSHVHKLVERKNHSELIQAN